MSGMMRTLLLAGFCLMAAACRPAPEGTPQVFPTGTPLPPAATASPTAEVPPTTAITPVPPTLAPIPERTRYQIDANLDWETRVLEAEPTVQYINRSGETLAELLFVVEPNWQADVFTLLELRWPQSLAPVQGYTLEDGFLRVPLLEPLAPWEHVSLEMRYRLAIPAKTGKLGFARSQLNLADWYPYLPPHLPGQGWLAYRPNPVGEWQAYEIADFDLRLVVNEAPEGLRVAAPVPVAEDGDVRIYRAEGYRNFALSLSPDFEVLEAGAGGVLVRSYTFRAFPEAGAAALEAAASGLEVFSELFGPYPHETFTLVSGNFPDGLEFDGLAFIGQEYYGWYPGSVADYLPLLSVHEVAHQWWLGQVGSDQAMEPWLDEALSIYSEYLWLEQTHPDLLLWWWAYRVRPFEPLEGAVNDPIYKYGSFRPYVNAVYLRGAEMIHEVRLAMGDERFLEGLRAYLERYRGGHASGEDFIAVMEVVYGGDLGPVWAVFFE